ncbi:beta family protein [Aeromicrobium sp. CF3.5]|uniref:beta family protein n=1 Tax=Aeromicrobium sp. CF3.5 TaxID=3373078 RepID=UPI003EE6F559
MSHYRPVLKAKPGELQALGNLSGAVKAGLTPILELCPDDDGPVVAVAKAMQKFGTYLSGYGVVCVDFGHLPHSHGSKVIPLDVATELASIGLSVVPVARMNDSAAALSSAATIAADHGQGLLLRVGVETLGSTVSFDASHVSALSSALGQPISEIDLVLDLGSIQGLTATQIASLEVLLGTAGAVGAWRSITVSAGAFPDSISGLAPGSRHDLPRYDATLWRELTSRGHQIDFGDYAVNHPALPGQGRGPLPNLRYTNGHNWAVWRESKTRPGNESFFDLCKKVLVDSAWSGATYSWGDNEIALKAAEATPKAGSATQWRAYGTSHHFTTVVDRLASLGEP